MRAIRQKRDVRACDLRLWALLLSVVSGSVLAQSDVEETTVRVLPQAVSTNRSVLRLGFQTGLLEGPGNPLRAECFSEENVGAVGRVSVKTMLDPAAGGKCLRVANGDEQVCGVTLTTRALRRGVGHTVRVTCRRVQGRGTLRFVFTPVGATSEEATEKRVSVKGSDFIEKTFAVTPHKDGAYVCAFEIEPGSVMDLSVFSMVPDDVESGWDHQALEALRAVSPGTLRWPAVQGLGFYNWYDGVGPRAVRRAVSSTVRLEDGHDFGTVEFVDFCRLVGADPVLKVTVFRPGMKDERVSDLAAGIQLAADWVAYCNATGRHPLAILRTRHGHEAPLKVKRWELVTREGGVPDVAVCGAYTRAMRAEDPDVDVCASPGVLAGMEDKYVAKVMRRLSEGDAADRRYYGEWYAALGMAYAAVERLRGGEGGDLCTAFYPEQVLYRVTYAKHMLAETGLLMALFNRYPAYVPLVTEGAPTEVDNPFRVQAAWTEDNSALVIFVYNSGPAARKVLFDLRGLKRHFGFWMADQLAADITERRTSQTLPVNRMQKAGAAITQWVAYEAAPSSFTRVLVKE